VVNDQNKLVGYLSASDLRGYNASYFELFRLPVLQFVEITQGKLRSTVSCLMKTTLREAALKVLQSNLHRIWITNERSELISVFSLSDFIRALTSNYISSPKLNKEAQLIK